MYLSNDELPDRTDFYPSAALPHKVTRIRLGRFMQIRRMVTSACILLYLSPYDDCVASKETFDNEQGSIQASLHRTRVGGRG